MIVNDRWIPDDQFVPFGAQYYRAPTPRPDQWERDLARIRGHGFNTIKLWAQWRWNNPADGVFDFADLSRLLDLSHSNGLKVVVNIVYDVAPAWLFHKYPDSVMVTNNGTRVEPAVSGCRQVGGSPGPSYLHRESVEARRAFTEELGKQLGKHPALYIWDLWNEPELNGFAFREPNVPTLVDYSSHALAAFAQWLRTKYESIEALNESWNRNYRHWDEVEVPRNPATFSDMIDWRMFFVDVMVSELQMRLDAIRLHDADTPVMVHTVPMPFFNMVTCASDEYRLAALCDLFGNSLGSAPFAAAVTSSAAPGKPIINAEIHAIPGSTINCPPVPDFETMKRHILVPLARGVKGFLFWQYRPETLGVESPAWGLTDFEGGPTPWLESAVRINDALQRHAPAIMKARPIPAQVAVVNGTRNQLFDWCVGRSIERHHKSIEGAFLALYSRQHNVDVISTDYLLEQDISRYRAIYYPFPYYIEDDVASRIEAWIADGGTLVSEAFFGSVRQSDGLHSQRVPGFGFDCVFGAREGLRTSGSAAFNQYKDLSSEADVDSDRILLQVTGTLIHGQADRRVTGYRFAEGLIPEGAEPLGYFEDGRVAITRATYGHGQAILIGTLLGYSYFDHRDATVSRLIADLVELSGARPSVLTDRSEVRADVLHAENTSLLVVVNTGPQASDVAIDLGRVLNSFDKTTDLISGEEVRTRAESGSLNVHLSLDRNGCGLYLIQ